MKFIRSARSAMTLCISLLSAMPIHAMAGLNSLLPSLYGGNGVYLWLVPGSAFPHYGHFAADALMHFNMLNDSISSQMGAYPTSSGAGGFAFEYDEELGTYTKKTQSLGPIFAERANTLGKGKFNFNVSYSFFDFNSYNGTDLGSQQIVADHMPMFNANGTPLINTNPAFGPVGQPYVFTLDKVLVNLNLRIHTQILNLGGTYGITDKLDVGALVPYVRIQESIYAHGIIQISPLNNGRFRTVHQWQPGATFNNGINGPYGPDSTASGSAAGLGDIMLHAKYQWLQSDTHNLAGALYVVLPTGDKSNFLGTGEAKVKPTVIYSRTYFETLTPHLNLGYNFDLSNATRNAVEYAAGFDFGASKTLTASADIIGRTEPRGDGTGEKIDGSVGFKWISPAEYVYTVNTLLPLNHAGLRSNLITMFNVEHAL
ncbi:MAG: transporter [Burkholderiales bacterium]|nr:transporter [Burkholderiales bacterium]